MPKVRPKKPQCVKIRLNHQFARNLHAPHIAAPYLCKHKCLLALLALLALSPPSHRRQSGRSAASAPRCKHRTPHPTRGADDQRQAFSLPREGLQPCVTPYFADLGVGDMRGQPSLQYTSPPRRRWQAVSLPIAHAAPPPRSRPARAATSHRKPQRGVPDPALTQLSGVQQ